MEYIKSTKLIFREYGRNIQNLVQYAMTVEDDEKRNEIIGAIINLMGQLNPHLRNVADFKHKLWDHLFLLSDFKLKADSPYPIPDKEEFFKKPEHMGYPKTYPKYRQYGRNVETMITKAIEMEDGEKREAYAEIIGSYMKLVYRNWNRENVSDDIIVEDLKSLSKGKLLLNENSNLDVLGKHQPRIVKKKKTNSNFKRRKPARR